MKINTTPNMKKHPILFTQLLVIVLYFGLPSQAQAQTLAKAQQFSNAGRYEEAEKMYQQLIAQKPGDLSIAMARAYNFSWWGRHIEALKGFSEVLVQEPGHFDALKGSAFAYLYKEDYARSIVAFEQAALLAPNDYDLYLGKGLAFLGDKQYASARAAFTKALSIKPDSAEAKRYLQTVDLAPGFIEGDIWVGYSTLAGQERNVNLRGLQLSLQASKNWRALLKYDNSMGLDILNLASQNRSVPMISGGLIREWNKKLFTEAEYGVRLLEKDQIQHFISAGQVIFLPQNMRIKLGGFAGFGQNLDKEWMGYLSFNLPATPRIRIEPTYYLILPPNSPGVEHRMQLGLQYQTPRGYQLNLYGTYGNTVVPDGAGREQFFGWGLTGIAPFSRIVWGQVAIRQEKGIYYDFTSVSLGAKLRINK